MSTENHVSVVLDVIERCKRHKGLKNDKDFAALLGLSAADFGNRKKRGTLFPLILSWSLNENVNLNWLIRGEDNREPYKTTKQISCTSYSITSDFVEWSETLLNSDPTRENWLYHELTDKHPLFAEWLKKRDDAN